MQVFRWLSLYCVSLPHVALPGNKYVFTVPVRLLTHFAFLFVVVVVVEQFQSGEQEEKERKEEQKGEKEEEEKEEAEKRLFIGFR